ncbi:MULTISPECIES: hypothetical protein [Micromonospora]|uniref:AMIN-like domain-containing protein n=1 Tax=Micromonospora solifontis TaxID=2487138 RepID=A0ABX9WBK9_9ACTN|nr:MULTISPECIES: hypothetical protein [Micromonospora]NES14969.1 hypothetical protein [Micromonospora sp. PPF5-17B]NES38559.1 hypothetical protein [Micromonospora solifontis]NES58592.1 hypothetical protein [Micromonospora sp. PPF5-6]RNL94581.1 hypothetical protein EFE23_20775 [Micromonospora solifontis]
MRPQRVPLLAGVVVLLAAACTTTDHDGATPAPSTAPAPGATAATTPASPIAPAATTAAPSAASDWRVTYGWAVPTSAARVRHPVRVPVTPAPGEPLPVLVRIEVGDHPAEGYSRITFVFRGPTPSYQARYVSRVESDGSGIPVSLPGNTFLTIRFDPAQAHDSTGRSTVSAPPRTIGYPALRGWAPAGDFEGYVTVGLGVRTSGGRLPVRLGESTRPDGTHVVSLDLPRG